MAIQNGDTDAQNKHASQTYQEVEFLVAWFPEILQW